MRLDEAFSAAAPLVGQGFQPDGLVEAAKRWIGAGDQRELPVSLDALARQTLAELVTRDMRGSTLHLHPEDLKLLGDAECALVLTPDATVRRGTVSLNHADGWIEQGTQPMLDALQGLIDDLEGDQ